MPGALAYCHAEDMRGLLGRVLDEVEDLRPELREAIERLRSGPPCGRAPARCGN